ncbi:MAG: alanine--glyoxylate aminotransferase family protein [bacterium]|nr:alanine--glyoxylate aminotransferase family protein [bacterium]
MHKKLFIPGPSEVRPSILAKLATPQIGHRSKDYSDLHGRILPKLQQVLYTKNDVFLWASSSTLVMEACVRNLSNKKVLSCVNGAFSKRWAQMCTANGIPNEVLQVEWGKPILPEMIDAKLQSGEFDCLTVVMNETSTGVESPIDEIAEVMKKYPDVMFCVDAVSCMAGVKIPTDEWGLDVVLAGVQKAFALPAGLTVSAISNRAFERAATVKYRGYYTDFLDMKKYNDKNQTPATPAIPQIFAMDAQLDDILAEGLDNRWERHKRLAEMTRNFVESHGFPLFPERKYCSKTLTCAVNAKGIVVADLNKELGKRGFQISNGYGDLKEKTFRIAHMGDVTDAEMKELLDHIDDILKTLPTNVQA